MSLSIAETRLSFSFHSLKSPERQQIRLIGDADLYRSQLPRLVHSNWLFKSSSSAQTHRQTHRRSYGQLIKEQMGRRRWQTKTKEKKSPGCSCAADVALSHGSCYSVVMHRRHFLVFSLPTTTTSLPSGYPLES